MSMDNFIKVATRDEIPAGGSKLVEVGQTQVALFNLEGELYALENVCTHDDGPLVDGDVVNGCEVICPRHGARFDIRTGEAKGFPAFMPTNTYQVREENGDVYMESPE